MGLVSVVYKYRVDWPDGNDRVSIWLPKEANILSAGIQNDEIVVWAAINAADRIPTVERTLVVVNTGDPFNLNGARLLLINTVTTSNGLVWHVFEEKL